MHPERTVSSVRPAGASREALTAAACAQPKPNTKRAFRRGRGGGGGE